MRSVKIPELDGMDFDQLSELATQNPDLFENLRRQAIDDVIAKAPQAQRHRLRCLQWRIDQERRRSASALGACIRISRMMWESVAGRGGLLDHLDRVGKSLVTGQQPLPRQNIARVIPIDNARR